MKKLALTFLAAFFGLFSIVAQTTLEEYNYLTKGYKIQIESGLDMKKGYRFEDIQTNPFEIYGEKSEVSLKALFKEGMSSPCAILIVYKRLDYRDKESVEYLCVPHHKSEKAIWDLHFSSLNRYSQADLRAVCWSLAKATAYYSQNN